MQNDWHAGWSGLAPSTDRHGVAFLPLNRTPYNMQNCICACGEPSAVEVSKQGCDTCRNVLQALASRIGQNATIPAYESDRYEVGTLQHV